jgi:hypothetical protein
MTVKLRHPARLSFSSEPAGGILPQLLAVAVRDLSRPVLGKLPTAPNRRRTAAIQNSLYLKRTVPQQYRIIKRTCAGSVTSIDLRWECTDMGLSHW